MHKLPKLSERGAVHILALLLLIGGLAASVYLVGQQTNLFPKAYSPKPGVPSLSSSIVAKRVFVTSTTYNGNLGGLAGADSKCQDRANAAGLNTPAKRTIWKAWLSDTTTSASSRLNHNNGPYKLVVEGINGSLVADNWADLTDGTIKAPIEYTENGQYLHGDIVFTYTLSNGAKADNHVGSHCSNWTSNASGSVGYGGVVGRNNYEWTDGSTGRLCNDTAHLYCFEQ